MSKILWADQYQLIRNGANTYDLTGSGTAAALITDMVKGNKKFVQGSCGLDVLVGYGVKPAWNGSFNMSNSDSDSLSFNVNGGTILDDGRLTVITGNEVKNYSMQVNGVDFTPKPISWKMIEGRLVGPGGGQKPTGAVGQFQFGHGTEAVVNGGFGTDLVDAPH